MANYDRTATVLDLLRGLRGLDPLKRLFWTELNYERIDRPISRQEWTDGQRALLAEDPVLFAGAGDGQGFQVIYSKLDSDRLLLTHERTIISKLKDRHPYALFVFSNRDQDRWHFVNVKQQARDAAPQREGSRKVPQLLRRITVGPEERLRTASERVAMLDVAGVTGSLFGVSPLDIQARHDEAFDVEAVTRQFFDQYQAVFRSLQADLQKQTGDGVWAHDYALQFLNRLMFLYFVQRKQWLGEDTEFLRAFWEAYQDGKRPRNSFFTEWLSVLFFEAFNNRFHGGHRQFPDGIRDALSKAPFLNGGLFKPNRLDTNPPRAFTITDDRFQQAFDFLEQYNFTIAEDSPLDQEVAVDPEMIGKVYESLVNVSSEADKRGDAGIFYTPRTEIDLMCRLALVDNLANHLGQQHKNLLYEVVFALEPEDKEAADCRVQAAGLWESLDHHLQEITVVDPACGSGSFLVGMLHILDDLQARAARHLGTSEDPYDRKKRIIGQSLYGVDVMEWACHVAELRLWLALIVDADIDTTAAHVRQEPLLPHFSFKIRCGDSLVQEVGGVNLAHVKGSDLVPSSVKRKITHHKLEKLRFYNNDEDREYRTEEQVKQAELRLFREILDAQDKTAEQQIVQLNQRIANPKAKQIRLDGTVETSPQMALEAAELQRQVQELEAHRERLGQARDALRSDSDVPFVWDIAFVEVFEGDSGGFDIVIGNPPYVTRTKIAPPGKCEADHTPAEWTRLKDEYKAKLQLSAARAYPRFFKWSRGQRRPSRILGKMNDLYVYFYFHGLSLLNSHGSFCFITSNSWLDVDYGKDLQEFLLRHSHAKLVLDNEVRRSFADADINTVIVLFSAVDESEDRGLEQMARFVMFGTPFEHIVSPIIFQEIEVAEGHTVRPEYRTHTVCQRRLLEEGLALEGRTQEGHRGSRRRPRAERMVSERPYGGGKWGGRYLRAPAVWWRVMERAGDRLTSMETVGEVRIGLMTGVNDWFFVKVIEDLGGGLVRIRCDDPQRSEHTLELQYVRWPVITKAREVLVPEVDPDALGYRVVLVPPDTDTPSGHLADYVKWGEAPPRSYHARPFFNGAGRDRWYRHLGDRDPADLVVPIGHKRRPVVGLIHGCLASDNFVEVKLHDPSDRRLIAGSVLSTFTIIHAEVFGRTNFGQGLLKTQTGEIASLPVVSPSALVEGHRRLLEDAFSGVATREPLMIYDEVRRQDRRALDDAFLAAVGFDDTAERAEVLSEMQDAACRMIWRRMAKSGNARESRQTYDEWLATGQPFGADVEDDEEEV